MPFTQEEAMKILKTAGTMRNGARFVVALTLGLREGEALGLQWRDLDFTRRTLTDQRSITHMTWKHGCPDDQSCGRRYAAHCPQKDGGGALAGEVKSSAGRRTVGITDPLVQVLEEDRKRQQRERELAADLWQEEDWVFTNQRGGPVHPKVDHDAWKELLRKAEVRDARLHDARHTAATILLLLDVPSRAVMDVMSGRRPR